MSFKQKIWSLSLSAQPALAEAIGENLGEDALSLTIMAPPRRALALVEALYDAEPDAAAINARLSILAMLQGAKPPKFIIKEMPKLDWLKKVAEDFPPLPIARWTVHGALHRGKVPNRRYALQIDATNAFGTGEHPSTRGCLLMLDRLFKNKTASAGLRKMLDMGCGSGILAMAFAQVTRGQAVGIDMDPDSVEIARNNARMNGLGKNIQARIGRGYRSAIVKCHAPYDLIMSNIFAVPLSHMAYDLKNHLRPGGEVILAGILNHQANRVVAAHRMQGLYLTRRMIIGEWTILALKRRERA
jgi:ribosomal protein L11 methyltransferase